MLFLLKNLYRKENGEYGLKLNLEAIENNYEAIIGEVILDKPTSIPTLFIKGEKSNYINEEDFEAISQNYLNVSFATGNEVIYHSGFGFFIRVDSGFEHQSKI